MRSQRSIQEGRAAERDVAHKTRSLGIRVWAVLMALVVVAAACSSGSDDVAAVDEATTTAPAETTTAAAVQTTASTSAPATTEAAPAEDATPAEVVFEADAELLNEQFDRVEAGVYRVDATGTPFSFTTSEEMMGGQPSGAAFFVIADVDTQQPEDQDLLFQRISHFSDPTNPAGTIDQPEDGWPADDIDGWLDAVVEGIEITNREDVTVGGLDAVQFDATLADGFECGEEHCAAFATNRLATELNFNPRALYRIWVIDQGDESPLLMHATILRDAQIDWFDTVDQIVATLSFGPTEPNPIPTEGDLWELGISADVPAGSVEIPALGGIRFELATERFVAQWLIGEFYWVETDGPADSELLLIESDIDGNPISTVDELMAAVTLGVTTATELDATTLAGFPTRVFDVETTGDNFSPALIPVNADESERGWGAPLAARLWVSETDRGLVLITAEAFQTIDDLPEVIEMSELIVSTLEFIELS